LEKETKLKGLSKRAQVKDDKVLATWQVVASCTFLKACETLVTRLDTVETDEEAMHELKLIKGEFLLSDKGLLELALALHTSYFMYFDVLDLVSKILEENQKKPEKRNHAHH
jgi:hypothetical protein